MIAKQIISENLPVLNLHDKISNVVKMMDDFGVSHLPIVHKGDYVGIISEEDIFHIKDVNQEISVCGNINIESSVFEQQHIFDAVEVIARNKQTIVPVITDKRKYVGSIIAFDVLLSLNDLINVERNSAIVVLELNKVDYSLSQVSQIVEYNDSRILFLYTKANKDSKKMQLTLRIETDNIESILESFNRYEYMVLEVHAPESPVRDVYGDRYENLMNYLDI